MQESVTNPLHQRKSQLFAIGLANSFKPIVVKVDESWLQTLVGGNESRTTITLKRGKRHLFWELGGCNPTQKVQ